MSNACFPGEIVRLRAGLTLQDAAGLLRLSPRYLRHIERHGGASLHLARRMAALYGCDGNVFIHSPNYIRQLGQGTAAEPFMPTTATGADMGTHLSTRASRRYRPPKSPVLTISRAKEEGALR